MYRQSDFQQVSSIPRRIVLAGLIAAFCNHHAISQVIEPRKFPEPIIAALVNISPWTYADPRSDFKGIETEIISELSRLSGLTIDIKRVPYARELMMLERGTATLTVGVRTENIDRLTFPLATLGTEEVIIVSLVGAKINSMADLPGKLVAQVRDADYLTASIADPRIKKYDTNGYEQSVNMLLEKRVDAVIGLRTSLSYAIRQNPKTRSQMSPAFTLNTREFCILVSRNFRDQRILDLLRNSAQTLMKEKHLERIREEYRKSLGN